MTDETSLLETPERAPEPPQEAGREIEVKLEADRAVMKRLLAQAPLAEAFAGARAQRLVSTYFDTPDDALAAAGLALRVRRQRNRRIMTLKWIPEGEGVFARGEAEVVLTGETPEIDRFDSALAGRIRDAAGGAPIGPRYTTDFRRRAGMVVHAGAEVEVAHDEGVVTAEGRSLALSELELEWRGGAPEGLHDLARRLVDAGARIGPLPKSGRGRLLARGEPAAPVRATTLALPPDATLEDLIAAATRACVAQFVGNWPALQETGAVEAIHQARVALRRLRSMLATVQKALPAGGFAPFRAEAKRIASAMGPARDLDSFIALVSDGPAESFPDDASFEALLAAARSRRAAAAADAQALIAAADTSRFVLDLDAFVERRGWRNGLDVEALGRLGEPASVFAAATLDRLDRRARKRGKKLRELPPEARHEVRIALKNLRYGADFFAPLFDAERDAKAFAKSLSRLQDVLGAYNDSVVARGVAEACEAEAGPAASRAAGAVCGWCARGVVDADETLLDAWKRYRKAPRFWR